ncbi:hypothetical protein DSM107003_15680 [Trichormus variabilis SAG 1403-4b]|uniref:Uncharacterized protein n=1 Tax=Trichormus variabilis SAG 1403-4b TaxID=447716 RepID=A0A3S1ABH8_ANAVA|nr:hypothetical protein DSM107003_15680 [Trichormus variabilis SAG 1403-4b]
MARYVYQNQNIGKEQEQRIEKMENLVDSLNHKDNNIAFPSLMKYTQIYSLFPVKSSLFPKTKKLCTSRAWELLYIY